MAIKARDDATGNPIDRLSPAENAVEVTPDDVNDLERVCDSLYIGGAGDVEVTLREQADGASVIFLAVPVGTILPVRAKRVWTTTTATGLVALYC